jgi:predicted dehydrogenase
VACELGHPPKSKEYVEHGVHAIHTARDRFGSYPEAVEAAGLEQPPPPPPDRPEHPRQISDDELIEDLYAATAVLGKRPSKRDILRFGEHAPQTYLKYIGESWIDVLETAGLDDYDPKDPPDSVREYQQLLGVSGEDRS